YEDGFHYNPLIVAQFGLHEYGKYHLGEKSSLNKLIVLADWLIEVQDSDGAIRYDYNWKHYLNDEPYEKGWVSALAQGQALSLLARSYHLTKEPKYLDAGNKALEFLV